MIATIVEQPRSHVARVIWAPDFAKVVIEVEARAGMLDVNHERRAIPHRSGYSLNVADAERPVQLGARQASPEDLAPPPDPAADMSLLPERTLWAFGIPFGQAWGVLGDGRLYYLECWLTSDGDSAPCDHVTSTYRISRREH